MTGNTIALAPLDDARIDEIEDTLFTAIARERDRDRAEGSRRATRRGRLWAGGVAAAGVLVVAALVGPNLIGPSGMDGTAGSAVDTASAPAGAESVELQSAETADSRSATSDSAAVVADPAKAGTAAAGREVIATASATIEVDDPAEAIAEIKANAVAEGGFVESLSIGKSGAPDAAPLPEGSGMGSDMSYLPSYPASESWITVRVPADRLDAVVSSLSDVGTVSSSRIDQQDVTTQVVDLRARVAALETSVERLTTLMAEATTTGDLLAAESELSSRQAELDSYRQQLAYLDSQVQLSSLTVSLVEPAAPVTADPAGFGDGIAAGWNGLIATLNGIVIGLGFLLPWIAVVLVLALVAWAVWRGVRSRRATRRSDAARDAES